MFYYVLDNDIILKYKVDFDSEVLSIFRQKVIDNCSKITHETLESDYFHMYPNNIYSEYRNITQKEIGEKEYFEETRTIYHIEYDEYLYPYLVKLIDRIINNDSIALNEIYNYDLNKEKHLNDLLSMNKLITQVSNELNKIDNLDIDKKIDMTKYLKKLIKEKEEFKRYNKNQEPIEKYYLKLQNLIELTLVDTIKLNEYNRIKSFLELDDKYDKMLKLKK